MMRRAVYVTLMQLSPQMSAELHFSSQICSIYRDYFLKNASFKSQVKAPITILSCTPANQMILHTGMKPFALVKQGFQNQNKHITQVSERTARLRYRLFRLYNIYDSEVSVKISASPFLLDDAHRCYPHRRADCTRTSGRGGEGSPEVVLQEQPECSHPTCSTFCGEDGRTGGPTDGGRDRELR